MNQGLRGLSCRGAVDFNVSNFFSLELGVGLSLQYRLSNGNTLGL